MPKLTDASSTEDYGIDPFMARTMVEALSKGINPLTGRALSSSDICSFIEVQEALLVVLEHCSIESTEQYLVRIKAEKNVAKEEKRKRNAKKYPRGGEAWSPDEEHKLLFMHRNGSNIYQIANTLKRTPGSISDRLRKLRITPMYHNKGRGAK